MKHDLIFHLVEKDEYHASIIDGEYIPQSIEDQGFIYCSTGFQINDIANRKFADFDHVLLLIIDTKRVEVPIKYEQASDNKKNYPHIYGPLNTIAVLDKIEIEPNENGKFELAFSSD